MLKGTILKNLFRLSAARCGCPEVAEKLIRRWLPHVYHDGEFVSHIEGWGDITLTIYREEHEPAKGKGRAWRIQVLNFFSDEEFE